ncbi:cytochrome b [Paraburkholderia strydomiana]|uniref:cytochrome b n=1 Tax=Paraburkholderia strydomiana TaxID=1245417 RepID=UPI0038BDAB26
MQRDQFSNASTVATRIAAGDDRTTYDRISIVLHWTTATLVVVQFLLAQIWSLTPRPTRHLMIVTHMSLGIVLTAVLIARIGWRLSPGHRAPPGEVGWIEHAARTVHYLLYVLLASEAVLGFVLRWSGNESMSFFGLQLAPPFPPFRKATNHSVGEAHDFIAWTIIVFSGCHAAAALFHHFFLRDNVLMRMLPGIKRRQ